MCGRYYLDPDTEDSVERLFNIRTDYRTSGDVTPGMSPLILHGRNGKIAADGMYWGMTGSGGSMIINARSENVYDRAMFRNSIADRRQRTEGLSFLPPAFMSGIVTGTKSHFPYPIQDRYFWQVSIHWTGTGRHLSS